MCIQLIFYILSFTNTSAFPCNRNRIYFMNSDQHCYMVNSARLGSEFCYPITLSTRVCIQQLTALALSKQPADISPRKYRPMLCYCWKIKVSSRLGFGTLLHVVLIVWARGRHYLKGRLWTMLSSYRSQTSLLAPKRVTYPVGESSS